MHYKEETPSSPYSISPVRNKTKRTGQRSQYHRGPLLFSKSEPLYNPEPTIHLSYCSIFRSEYFQDQPKVTLSFKYKTTELTYKQQWCIHSARSIRYALVWYKISFLRVKRRFNQVFNRGHTCSKTTCCFKRTMVLYMPRTPKAANRLQYCFFVL